MLVKKYGNRRLYDTEGSRYITLDDLAAKIRGGEDVTVVDAKTGHDLTQATLAQIILESRGAARLLPAPLLKQLIRMGDDALAEFFSRYMTWALDVYIEVRKGSQAIAPFAPFAPSILAPAQALSRFFMSNLPWGEAPRAEPPSPPPAPASSTPVDRAEADGSEARHDEDIAELRREIEELKRAVGRRARR